MRQQITPFFCLDEARGKIVVGRCLRRASINGSKYAEQLLSSPCCVRSRRSDSLARMKKRRDVSSDHSFTCSRQLHVAFSWRRRHAPGDVAASRVWRGRLASHGQPSQAQLHTCLAQGWPVGPVDAHQQALVGAFTHGGRASPPGPSHWHTRDHRLLSHSSLNGRGRPVVRQALIVARRGAPTLRLGLPWQAACETGTSPPTSQVSDPEMGWPCR